MIVTRYVLRCNYCGKESDASESIDNLVERYGSWQEGKWEIETQDDLEKYWDGDDDCPTMELKDWSVRCPECRKKHQELK